MSKMEQQPPRGRRHHPDTNGVLFVSGDEELGPHDILLGRGTGPNENKVRWIKTRRVLGCNTKI